MLSDSNATIIILIDRCRYLIFIQAIIEEHTMIQPTLGLNLGQRLQLTPRLQQAIHLLQLSTQELNQELMTLLESNVMLELDDPLSHSDSSLESSDESACDSDIAHFETAYETLMDNSSKESDDTHPHTQNWQLHSHESLQTYLLWQLRASRLSDLDFSIGQLIIETIDDNGFLQESLSDIQQELAKQQDVSLKRITAVLDKIHRFDPLGVGARDLQDTLRIQLQASTQTVAIKNLASEIVAHHLKLLAAHRYESLAHKLQCSSKELDQAINCIQSLNPRPGSAYLSNDASNYILPDLFIVKKSGYWQVKLNPLLLPQLRFNQDYLSLLKQSSLNAERQFIHSHWQEAKWLMQCLKQRHETLFRVANCITHHQQGFMTHGPGAMKALILKDVATELNLHASTISRVSTKKYLQTPQGTFELKYFFNSHITTDYGQPCSARAIQSFIKALIEQEDHCKPFSDHALTEQLASQGLRVARRTIVKYRDLLHIPSAALRRRMPSL